MSHEPLYCEDLFNYHRNPTRPVKVGIKTIGGNSPIQIQSMTTTNSLDAEATATQVMSILDAGADIVRITTQGRSEAHTLEEVKRIIRDKGYEAPLVADIHFNPNAAKVAASNVEKVRINPGNFSGGAKKFNFDYTNQQYNEELAVAKSKLSAFLGVCKQYGTAIRVGTNHGSLSDRIMSRYGDTPQGMVEACMEYLRTCEELDFKDIVLSIKASNTRIMVHTVRLLVTAMKKENMNYPLHLGVTEAGSEDEGRIKSAVGSGALLVDGLGDTIRVSLTEDPEKEVPVATKLVKHITARNNHQPIPSMDKLYFTPFEYNRRKTHVVLNIGGDNAPVVICEAVDEFTTGKALKPDYLMIESPDDVRNHYQKYLIPFKAWKTANTSANTVPVLTTTEFIDTPELPENCFLAISYPGFNDEIAEKLRENKQVIILLESSHINRPVEQRALIFKLIEQQLTHPVVLNNNYEDDNDEDFQIKSAADAGILFLDGLADGLFLHNLGKIKHQEIINTAFGILQSSRVRFTKTEFISCPGCGRTLFDLQETTRQVKARTSHLKGLKVAVMGCVVNGVGEMADADYGYIGSGPDTVSLFKKRELIKRNLSKEEAVDELINLIKEHGDWVEPPQK
ncbi:(E)-4-hydroxy-3-methylbut-2-enyl-diphosphate synthase [Carboxylicivirga sediminis]|uniref:4-hydroxy-3-methylbut-2-en-1-yl diphosphate synthase (flavodoxin) n=1 Tax=Carboxylicivirga sediminis TaxID=2006564 RepID=A0A941F0N2_9BACT|nr:(E)-4-hydroxy-3-methylbut-2-enyl-diphosphate synthase [Carboxylicivirga sediminis]MBR8534753.1 (E)-4-hydroxy-3-methylbut-2-enyl-diphosphate synthase [Carboxylicivirga sediminis]